MKFNHIGINCKDLEKSLFFYCDLLGLTKAKSVDMGECILHYLSDQESPVVELFEFKDTSIYKSIVKENNMIRHLAFQVEDLKKYIDKLKKNQCIFTMELCEMPELGIKAVIVKDPDGVEIELLEYI